MTTVLSQTTEYEKKTSALRTSAPASLWKSPGQISSQENTRTSRVVSILQLAAGKTRSNLKGAMVEFHVRRRALQNCVCHQGYRRLCSRNKHSASWRPVSGFRAPPAAECVSPLRPRTSPWSSRTHSGERRGDTCQMCEDADYKNKYPFGGDAWSGGTKFGGFLPRWMCIASAFVWAQEHATITTIIFSGQQQVPAGGIALRRCKPVKLLTLLGDFESQTEKIRGLCKQLNCVASGSRPNFNCQGSQEFGKLIQ
jgi:hypothetical protein